MTARTCLLLLASPFIALFLFLATPVHAATPDAGSQNGIGTSPSSPTASSSEVTTTTTTTVAVTNIPDLDKDPGGFLASILAAAKSGQWRLLAAGLLMALVWAARRFGAKAWPWLATDRGGAALVMLLAILGGIATTLGASDTITFGLFVNSLSVAFTAAGGWAILKKVAAPSDIAQKGGLR